MTCHNQNMPTNNDDDNSETQILSSHTISKMRILAICMNVVMKYTIMSACLVCACLFVFGAITSSIYVDSLEEIQWKTFVLLEGLIGVPGEGWIVPHDSTVIKIEYCGVNAPNHDPAELVPYYHFITKEWRELRVLELNGTDQMVTYSSYRKSEFVRFKWSFEYFTAILHNGHTIDFFDPTIFKSLSKRVGNRLSSSETVMLSGNQYHEIVDMFDPAKVALKVLYALSFVFVKNTALLFSKGL